MEATLLIELLTEELPPRSLKQLGYEFALKTFDGLGALGLVDSVVTFAFFATPRRFAVLVPNVREKSADVARDVQGPSVSASAQAVAGFARKCGIAIEALKKQQTPKGEVYVAHVTTAGQALTDVLSGKVEAALKALPIAKLMRWGSGDAQFVRPVHGLVMLHGSRVVPGEVLGIESGNRTRGHRFMGRIDIVLKNADEYEARLRDDGMVIANFSDRCSEIELQLQAEAKRRNGSLGEHQDLLDEVTALVEHPTVYAGAFDPQYLELPQECLILTMRKYQKYFPLLGEDGKLLPTFLIVSNMKLDNPRNIVEGNQRVVRARLEDARFLLVHDRKTRLEARVSQLEKVVYHNKLGTELQHVTRLQRLAGHIAGLFGTNRALAERAAWLAKADLLTGMVGEFPELQGIMGRYYARHDGEPPSVCEAIGDQYRLRFDDADPENLVSVSLYLADRIDRLIGFFGIGQAPTGEKDQYGLRRAALGVISVFQLVGAAHELRGTKMPEVRDLLAHSATLFPEGLLASPVVEQVHDFILERYWHNLATVYPRESVEAVISVKPRLDEIAARLRAVEEFRKLPEAASLAAANKRIRNILHKSAPPSGSVFSEHKLSESGESALNAAFRKVDALAAVHLEGRRFVEALSCLAALKAPVDAFFDSVMVNVEDPELRTNRLVLLQQLDRAMNRVADISKLAA